MSDKMQIDVWSDIACPFCYIGKSHLTKALNQFPHKDDVQVNFHSFELNQEQKPDAGSFLSVMKEKQDGDQEKTDAVIAELEKRAKESGVPLNLDKTQVTNTFDAHRLLQYAKTVGPKYEVDLMNNLFDDYFVRGLNVSKKDVLIEAATAAGLNKAKVEKVLASDDFGKQVRIDEGEAQSMGLAGVPFYVFNRKYAVSGAQPESVFKAALEKAWKSFKPKNDNGLEMLGDNTDGKGCENGSCHLDNK